MTTAVDSLPAFARPFISGPGVTRIPTGLRHPVSRRAWRAMSDVERAEHLGAMLAEERARRLAPARAQTPARSGRSPLRVASRPLGVPARPPRPSRGWGVTPGPAC